MVVSEDAMLAVRLSQIGFSLSKIENDSKNTNNSRFLSAYGASTRVCCYIFEDITIKDLVVNPKAYLLLICLHWLKRYPVEKTMSAMFGLDEDTVRKWIWIYCSAIQHLKDLKVNKLDIGSCFMYFFFLHFLFSE